MLKRVQKRIQKKEKEAELGLDDDTKEILGFNDTDSDESDSSGFDSEGEDSDNPESLEENISDDQGEGPIEVDEEEWEQSAESDTDEIATVTVQEALNDPIYVSSLDAGGGEWQCVVCPGKIFKGSNMIDAHRESKAHKRRFTNFSKLAKSSEPTSNASEVLSSLPKPQRPEDGISNRASKREKSIQIRKEKRLKQREKAKAKVAKKTPQSEGASPQRKRKRAAEPAEDDGTSPRPKVAAINERHNKDRKGKHTR